MRDSLFAFLMFAFGAVCGFVAGVLVTVYR